jgi:hypothetical protein
MSVDETGFSLVIDPFDGRSHIVIAAGARERAALGIGAVMVFKKPTG